MRYVKFDPETLTGDEKTFWTAWIKRSERAKEKASKQHARNEKIKLNAKVWKELKEWLLKHVFYGKCAYCEGKYSYWWLAYDWRNLVPACDLCNGEPGGKMNEFPVGKSHVFEVNTDIDELDEKEDPLLLHPYDANNKPEDHLKFGLQGVVAEDKSSHRGKVSIRVCNLWRRTLNEERAEEQEKSKDRFLSAVCKLAEEQIPIKVTMSNFTGPKARYSQSVTAYIEHRREKLRNFL
jgi:hypothetical protein